ncbi:hypothetical protein [Dethiosulfatarculus sandiegensis]|uniref:Uncharacterized protein n=1 Tax=Dethiosulfatarculus sandiegensis TaxID=1429043 RepID=A0A0D2JBD8_9BACT|nr:hypothetical protein [Dethiosulfatarculus sandiegensis]KIX15444.1 hypothetical protein X474_03920 [Dethiosulfatarculus sandiegensis]
MLQQGRPGTNGGFGWMIFPLTCPAKKRITKIIAGHEKPFSFGMAAIKALAPGVKNLYRKKTPPLFGFSRFPSFRGSGPERELN